MGNILLTEDRRPRSNKYFIELPENFSESALIDRFHGFRYHFGLHFGYR